MEPKQSVDAASVHSVVMRRFADEQPEEGTFFCFVCPEQKDRWIVGWRDWYHYRVELGPSYLHDDERLTYWVPLPQIPAV